MMIESPRVTARDVRWESYEELAAFLAQHDPAGAEPQIFQNDRGHWVRWWAMDDPDQKRFDSSTQTLQSRRYYVQRRVALQVDDETTPPDNRSWDFVLPAAPGETLYGQPYVWMHGGVKPETDPGFWYAREHAVAGQRPTEIREEWRTSSTAETAAFMERERKLRESTGLTQVVQAPIEAQEPAPAAGGKGK